MKKMKKPEKISEIMEKLPSTEDFAKKVQSMNMSQLINMQKDLDKLNQILVELNNKTIEKSK
jgi:hypothetical protein